tara:strand:- start:1088 stop:1312 length:225 start_codon:yes stop_codon:yes gene_type:complete
MKILFRYRKEGGRVITTNNGDKKIMVIRAGVRGIISRIAGGNPIIIWGREDVNTHINDSEDDLIKKTIEVLEEK